MSAQESHSSPVISVQRPRSGYFWFTLCISMIALSAITTLIVNLYSDTRRSPSTVPYGALFQRANSETIEQAQSTVNLASEQINQYLALLQTLTAILGITGVLIAVLGLWNQSKVSDLRIETELLKVTLLAQQKETQQDLEGIAHTQQEIDKKLVEIGELKRTLETTLNNKFEQNQQTIQSVLQLQYALGQADLGNTTAALTILQNIHERLPDDPVVNYYLGDFLVRQGKFKEGSGYLDKARQTPNFWAAKASYAYSQRVLADDLMRPERDRQYVEIDNLFREIYIQDQNLLDVQGESAFGAWGGMYKRWEKFEDAARIYTHCAKITPPSSYPLINLGVLHLENAGKTFGNFEASYDEGINCFKQAGAKAKLRMSRNPTDHWPIFDAIVSLTVTNETGQTTAEIKDLWERVGILDVIGEDIKKLKDSLEKLLNIPNIKDRVQSTLDLINAKRP